MCMNKCNGMIITSFSTNKENKILREAKSYKKYKKSFKGKTSSSIEGDHRFYFYYYVNKQNCRLFRISVEEQDEICKDIF